MEVSFDADVAIEHGIRAAVVLNHIAHLMRFPDGSQVGYFKSCGRAYVHVSPEYLWKMFPFMSLRQATAALRELREGGLIAEREAPSRPQSPDGPFKAPKGRKTSMAVLRKAHKSNFTVIDNQVFKSNLSLKARGLLCTMLSLPDNWEFSEKGLQMILPADGQTSVRTAIKELEGSGYLSRTRLRDAKGKIIDWLWTFSDYPQENQTLVETNVQVTGLPQCDYPSLENPNLDKPNLDKPNLETQRQLNTKQSNTNEERKKGASTDGYATAPAKAAPEKKGTYGCYGNVKLSDTDLSKLKAEFPADWQERIDRLSTYMDSSGKSYKNHLATIRTWARRDAERGMTPKAQVQAQSTAPARPEMSIDDIMEKHGVDYMTAMEMHFDGTY